MGRSPEYNSYIKSPTWRARSNRCIAAANKRCVLFPWLRATQSHHLTYANFQHEWLIRDIVPLSKSAHKIVHWWILWKTPLRVVVNLWLRISCVVWCILGLIF